MYFAFGLAFGVGSSSSSLQWLGGVRRPYAEAGLGVGPGLVVCIGVEVRPYITGADPRSAAVRLAFSTDSRCALRLSV